MPVVRRRSRRRKSSYEMSARRETSDAVARVVLEELSPRARRLVEAGVIDLDSIAGSGPGGRITSGDILHAARVMEVEQSVARIETAHQDSNHGSDDANDAASDVGDSDVVAQPEPDESATDPVMTEEEPHGSSTSSAVDVGGEPIAVAASPWDAYNGSTDGLADIALPGADKSWGEAEAHIVAMAAEAAAQQTSPAFAEVHSSGEIPEAVAGDQPEHFPEEEHFPEVEHFPEEEHVPEFVEPIGEVAAEVTASADAQSIEHDIAGEPQPEEAVESEAAAHGEVMMDFGTLELVDPESVWAEGAEDFAPWFLAHSRQLGDVLGLRAGLTDARQFTTKSATGVLGRDDNGEDVVVVSSQRATASDSDLGRALGMAASSGAATVALVSAALPEDQLKALAWLNNQTKSGVKWYGIEMRVVRIADSPAAMLFDLVAAPPPPQ